MTPQRIKEEAEKTVIAQDLQKQLEAQDANVEILLDNQKRFIADIEMLNDEIKELEKENDELSSRAQQELKTAQDAAKMFCNKHNETATQLAELVDKTQGLVDAPEAFIEYCGPTLINWPMVKNAEAALAKWKGEGDQ